MRKKFLQMILILSLFTTMGGGYLYGQSSVTKVTNATELAAALAKSGTVELENDIELSSTIEIPFLSESYEMISINLDLNGHKISAPSTIYPINNNATLTISDKVGTGVIEGLGLRSGYDNASGTRSAGANLTINGGTFKNLNDNEGAAVYIHQGLATINGGDFIGNNAAICNAGGVVTIEGGYFEGYEYAIINSATIKFNKGKLNGLYHRENGGACIVTDQVTIYEARIVNGNSYTSYEKLNGNDGAFKAAQNGDKVQIIKGDIYNLDASGKNLTITGATIENFLNGSPETVVFDEIGAKNMNGASVTFNNVTFKYTNADYTGLQHSGDMVYNNCTFNGQPFLYGNSETFNKCTFNQKSSNAYNVWTYGAKEVAFNECTFNSAGKSVLIYKEKTPGFVANISVNECEFIATSSVEGKAAIEMNSSLIDGINLTIDATTTATGFAAGNASGNTLWNNKMGNANDANNNITVVVDGETVLAPIYVAQRGDNKHRTLQEAITDVQNGETITLLMDCAENVTVVQAPDKAFTIDGAQKTMSGTITVNGKSAVYATAGLTIKNVKFDATNISKDASINLGGNNNIRYTSNVTVDNCTFTGTGKAKVAVMNYTGGCKNVTITNCTATGLHSLAQLKTSTTVTLNNNKVTDSKSGVSLGSSTDVTVEKCEFNVDCYGIRPDGGASVIVTDSKINAFIPVVVRNASEDASLTFNGTNTMTASNTDGLWCAIGTSEYETNGNLPTDPTARVIVTLNDNGLSAEGIYGNFVPVAQIMRTVEGAPTELLYASLKDAVNDVQNGETIKLLENLDIDSETFTIADGKSVTLNMNAKKITVTDNKTSNYELFYIYGEMTVTGNGTIELTSTNNREWNAMSAIFHNRGGVLTIENGTYKNLGGTDMAWAIDNSGNYYGNATTNIKGGVFTSTYTAIRNRMEQNEHGASGTAILNIYSGEINGTTSAIWAQAASESTVAPATGEINITGGEVGLINTARSAGAKCMTTISGGTVASFKGESGELTVKDSGKITGDIIICDTEGNAVEYMVVGGVYYGKTLVESSGTWGGIDWTLTHEGTLTIAPTTGTPVPDPNCGKEYAVGAWREAVKYDATGEGIDIAGWPYDRTKVKKLIIEEGVISIGSFTAQSFTNLTGEVVIPYTVKYIGQEAFQKSTMTKVTFEAVPEGKTGEELCIAQGAFKELIIEEISLPADRTVHLHAWVFNNCHNLKNVIMPATITSVHGTNHIDYFKDFNAHSNPKWTHSSEIFAYNENMETVTFGNEEVMDMFYANNNGTSKDYLKANVGLVTYCDVQDAIDAAAVTGETITLVKTTEAGSEGNKFNIPSGKTITIDLEGKTMKGSILAPDANLTVKNGTIKNEDESVNALEINAGTLTLEGVNISSARHAVRIDGAVTATINGGNYTLIPTQGMTHHALNISRDANVTIKAGTFVGPKGTTSDSGSALKVQTDATVTIEGGDFSGGKTKTLSVDGTLVVKGGTFDQKVEAGYLAEGYVCQMNADGKYEVFFAVASITNAEGTIYYASLQEAINAGGEITVLCNIELNEGITVPADKTVVLDLNGYIVSQTKAQTAGYQMILNDGNLTINDSSNPSKGKISYTDSGNGGNYISDVIYNRATLVINGGTIENLSSETVASNGFPHAVDTYSGIRNTSVTINGGTIYCAEYSAVRMFCVSATNKADLVINDGTVKGAIDMQNGTTAAALGTLTINGGTFETTKNANNIRFANWNNGATTYGITASIEGGNFKGGISTAYVPAAANWNIGIISGGTFASDMSEFCAAGYACTANGDGTYGVSLADYVVFPEGVTAENYKEKFGANIVTDGTNYYATMKAALEGIHTIENIVLYCKPGADLGVMTHGHVCASLTVYGNDAYVSSGEHDFEVDTYKYCHNNANTCSGIPEELSLEINYLHKVAVWGQRTTDNTVNVTLRNCKDVNRICITGTTTTGKSVNNVYAENCTFNSANGSQTCTTLLHSQGTTTFKNCDFTDIAQPICVNNKSDKKQIITVENCRFDNCGSDAAAYNSPVRVVCTNNGMIELSVTDCIFSNTNANGAGQTVDVLIDTDAAGTGVILATVDNTVENAKPVVVMVETEINSGETTTVAAGETKSFANSAPVAMIGDALYYTFEAAIAAAVADANITRIEILRDYTQPSYLALGETYSVQANQNLTIAAPEGKSYTITLARTAGKTFSIYQKSANSSLTIAENVTIEGLDILANGFSTSANNTTINGTLKALSLKQWTSGGTITVSETGKVWLGYGDGQFDLTYGNGSVVINGPANTELTEPQFKAGYSGTRGDGNTLTLNNTYFEAGAWFNLNGSNGTININNSLLKVSGGDAAGKMTIIAGNTIYVNEGSTLECATITLKAGAKIVVNGGTLKATTVINDGTIDVTGESTLNIETLKGSNEDVDEEINFLDGAIVKNSTVGGDVFVAGNVTFRGANTFAMLSDYGTLTDYYGTTAPMKWTVEEGGSLTLTKAARYGLGYGDDVTVKGRITDALTARENLTEADRSLFMHGLVAQESSGWNCSSKLNVEDAYVVIGSNNSFGNKSGNYGGNYTFNINNSVVDASRITFYDAPSTTTFTFDGSDVKMGTFMTRDADSKFTLKDSKVLSTATQNGTDEGNYNAGELVLENSSLTYSAAVINTGAIEIGAASTLTAPTVTNNGTITFTADDATLVTETEGLTINYNLNPDKKVVYGEVDGIKQYYVVDKVYVAQTTVNNEVKKFESLQEAIEAVEEGGIVTLIKDVTVTEAAYGQNAINHARAISFTLDLNAHTLSANTGNSVFRFNIANSGATSNVTVTIKNGKVVSGANTWCTLMASGISADVKAVMNLEDLTIEASKAGDLTVKAWENSLINANKVTVNATNGAGGFYAVGGEIILDNCTVEQKGLHTAPYMSMAIAVSTNGKLTVNSGTYSSAPTAAEEGNNQGTTHGSWVAGVMNSGGTLIINGGTFSNDNYGDNSLATDARGAILADTGANVEINGGTFNALAKIFDIQNNLGDANNNPTGVIKGGIYSADPTNDYIKIHQDYKAVQTGNVYTIVQIAGTQTRELVEGWQWFSTYIKQGDNGLDSLQKALNTYGVEIKSREGFTRYYSGLNDWSPSQTLTSVSTTKMYMIKTSDDHTLKLTGNFENENVEITLAPGWNWIGYPLHETISFRDALANLTPEPGDGLKSKSTSVSYIPFLGGWTGTLDMTPGEGYMYFNNSNTTKTFSYSTEVTGSSRSNTTVEENHWIADINKYPGNMTMTAMLSIDGEIVKDNYEIAAFANGECRGSARPIYIEALDVYVLLMTIQGEEVEELTFKYYDVNYGTEYELNNRINYSDNAIVGSFDNPYMFNLGILNIEETSIEQINIYPNPTTTSSEINLQATCDKVEVFNALGVKVAEYNNVDSIDALETAGVYVIRVTIDGNVRNCRLVVR